MSKVSKADYEKQRQQLQDSGWVHGAHRTKWEFIEKRLGRMMTKKSTI